jgi:hypothetical protein
MLIALIPGTDRVLVVDRRSTLMLPCARPVEDLLSPRVGVHRGGGQARCRFRDDPRISPHPPGPAPALPALVGYHSYTSRSHPFPTPHSNSRLSSPTHNQDLALPPFSSPWSTLDPKGRSRRRRQIHKVLILPSAKEHLSLTLAGNRTEHKRLRPTTPSPQVRLPSLTFIWFRS